MFVVNFFLTYTCLNLSQVYRTYSASFEVLWRLWDNAGKCEKATNFHCLQKRRWTISRIKLEDNSFVSVCKAESFSSVIDFNSLIWNKLGHFGSSRTSLKSALLPNSRPIDCLQEGGSVIFGSGTFLSALSSSQSLISSETLSFESTSSFISSKISAENESSSLKFYGYNNNCLTQSHSFAVL